MTEKEIDRAIAEFGETLELLKPYLTEKVPQLLVG
jgi:hypothetical protein